MDKEKQKQAITEIMNDDAKDGLYKQQTSVEWLEERFEKFLSYYEGHHKAEPYSIHQLSNDFEQAKQMERERIEKAYNIGEDSGCSSTQGTGQLFIDGKDYYTQTYGE